MARKMMGTCCDFSNKNVYMNMQQILEEHQVIINLIELEESPNLASDFPVPKCEPLRRVLFLHQVQNLTEQVDISN